MDLFINNLIEGGVIGCADFLQIAAGEKHLLNGLGRALALIGQVRDAGRRVIFLMRENAPAFENPNGTPAAWEKPLKQRRNGLSLRSAHGKRV